MKSIEITRYLKLTLIIVIDFYIDCDIIGKDKDRDKVENQNDEKENYKTKSK